MQAHQGKFVVMVTMGNWFSQAFESSLAITSSQSLAWLGEALLHEYTGNDEGIKQAKVYYKNATGQGTEVTPTFVTTKYRKI